MTSLALKTAMPHRIETARLVLRAPVRCDLETLVSLADNRKLHDVLARLPHPYTRADGIGFIDLIVPDPTETIFALTLDGALIGVAGLTPSDTLPPELGYWLGEPHWGHGFATEGVGALVSAAFDTGLTETITARCMAGNAGSAHVLDKLGFAVVDRRVGNCGVHHGVSMLSLVRERGPAAR